MSDNPAPGSNGRSHATPVKPVLEDLLARRIGPGFKLSSTADLPTRHGHFKIRVVQDHEERDHVLVVKGEVEGAENVPVRVHSECLTSEVFHSLRCDCRQQLAAALDHFEAEGLGVLIYLRQEGRGIGLLNKINAYHLQDNGYDTVDANTELGLPIDSRSYDMAAHLLRSMGVRSVCLMTNNPQKLEALRQHDIAVTRRIAMHSESNPFNGSYLKTKRTRLDHLP